MKRIWPLLLCVFLSGCYVQSLNKFYTEDLKVDLPQIYGEWESVIHMGEDVSDKKISPWIFSADTIETHDEDNKYSELEVTYFGIADKLFLDFTAGEPTKGSADFKNFFWGAGVTLTHSLCQVSFADGALVLIPLNLEWFEGRRKKDELGLSFVKADKDSNTIFTASAEQWVSFLQEHASDGGVFDENHKFVFKKKTIETSSANH